MVLIYAGFNARLRSSLVVKSDGWTDITGWRPAGATNVLSEADGGLYNKGRFYPFQQGTYVYGYLPKLLTVSALWSLQSEHTTGHT